MSLSGSSGRAYGQFGQRLWLFVPGEETLWAREVGMVIVAVLAAVRFGRTTSLWTRMSPLPRGVHRGRGVVS